MRLIAPPFQKGKTKRPTGQRRSWILAAVGLGLVGLLCSCGSSNYGKLQSSHDITRLFESAQVLPDHVYYYSGLEGVPDAIIGIHANYTLREKRWSQVDFTHERLQKWTFRMRYVHLVSPQGAWILGPRGDRLGIWFSAQRQTPVRLDRSNRLVVIPPLPPDLRGVP
ncbi:MAG: hypothetical protein R3274_11715 [Desulfobacterales bacterium]|nr:hypothetical protein [Desulfobacterales bacterium]